MDYIVFIIALQIPFLYFLWKFFQTYESRVNIKLRMLQRKLDNTDSLHNAMRIAYQKSKGDMSLEIDSLKSELITAKNHIQQLERHTGLRKSSPIPTMEWNSESLQNKDFI